MTKRYGERRFIELQYFVSTICHHFSFNVLNNILCYAINAFFSTRNTIFLTYMNFLSLKSRLIALPTVVMVKNLRIQHPGEPSLTPISAIFLFIACYGRHTTTFHRNNKNGYGNRDSTTFADNDFGRLV